MSDTKPILTIAIPTYNRSRYLEQLLNALVPQLRHEPRVELIVSDNASTDDTQGVIARFQSDGLALKSSLNDVNLGPDANIHRCFELAHSKYVWIIGDDDVVSQDAVSKVLSYLAVADYDLIYLNSKSYETSYVHDVSKAYRSPAEFTDAHDFARLVNIWFTFISGNVVNKERAVALAGRPFSDFVGTTIVQLSWVFTLLSSFRKGLYVFEPLVGAKADNTGNYSACRVFGVTLKDVSESLLPDRKISAIMVDNSIKHTLPRILMTLRFRDHTFHDEDPEKILEPCIGGNFRYWVFCYPLLHLPKALAWIWYYALRVFARVERTVVIGSLLLLK